MDYNNSNDNSNSLYNNNLNESHSASNISVNNNASSSTTNITFDISQFNPDIVKQVQQEYWKNQIIQQSATLNTNNTNNNTVNTNNNTINKVDNKSELDILLESLSNVSSITSELRTTLDMLKKETNILEVIATCQKKQNEKERQLYKQRAELLREHKKELDTLQARGFIGADITNDKKELDMKCKMERAQMDKHIIREMDKEIRSQQEILKKLKVPLFNITKDTDKIELQHQVLKLLLQ